MSSPDLGQIESAELQEAWPKEDADFTPWLARAENLQMLSEALDLDLALEESEKPVGSFRADLVCLDESQNVRVVIENQLEQTDHKHLGQLLAYAAGLNAQIVIWIAREFRDEHKEAIDWLNSSTINSISAYAVEVHLWRIDGSRPAPKFEVVSRPSEWQRSNRGSEKENKYTDFWRRVVEQVSPEDHFKAPKPPNRTGARFPTDSETPLTLRASFSEQKRQLRVFLVISGPQSGELPDILLEGSGSLVEDVGESCRWGTRTRGKSSAISLYKGNVDPLDSRQIDANASWIYKTLQDFQLFWILYDDLDVESWDDEDEGPASEEDSESS